MEPDGRAGFATYLDEVLALGLGNERLKLGGGKCVDETGFGHDKEKHLGAGQDGKLVSLNCCQLIVEVWARTCIEFSVLTRHSYGRWKKLSPSS